MYNFQTQTQDALTKIMKNIMTILDSKQDQLPLSDRRAKENSNEAHPEDLKTKGDTSTVKIVPKKTESTKPSRQFHSDKPKMVLPSYCEMRLADQDKRESENHHDEIAPRSLCQVPKLVMRGRRPPSRWVVSSCGTTRCRTLLLARIRLESNILSRLNNLSLLSEQIPKRQAILFELLMFTDRQMRNRGEIH